MYKVWYDMEEQWDPARIEPPARVISAACPRSAAEMFARNWAEDDSMISLILQDEDGRYHEVSIGRTWTCTRWSLVTLEKLCAP